MVTTKTLEFTTLNIPNKEVFTWLLFLLLSANLFAQTPTYELVWADEFEGEGAIDSDKWHHQTLLPNGNSWYNGEIQHYTDREVNSYQSDGTLKIVAKRETFTDQGVTKEFTSARLNSKFAFTYGKVEVRAKLPTGVGTWPAIWTLGQNITEPGGYWEPTNGTTPWPACGELDIMEHWGINQDYVQSAIHTPSSHGNTVNKGGQVVQGVSDNFFVYTMEWTPEQIKFWVDDVLHYTYQPAVQNLDTWPFDANQYILLNVAILPDIAASFDESTLEIDYVRVYQESTLGVDDVPEYSFTLSPNPANGHVMVQAAQAFDSITVYTGGGKKVWSETKSARSATIDTTGFSSGVYYIKVFKDGKTTVRKLIVN